MVAGHLQEKKGRFYIVLSYTDIENKRKTKWIPTGLPVKNNKKRAEKMLMEAREKFKPPVTRDTVRSDMLFSDYLTEWLKIIKSTVRRTTFSSYSSLVKSVIKPYFEKLEVTLDGLKPIHIQTFYTRELERVTSSTVIHYHAVIRRALIYAVKIELLDSNPIDRVERPKKEHYIPAYYDSQEINRLFELVAGTDLEVPVKLAAFYGLRREEVLGLRWKAIDFEENTITINHTVTQIEENGKTVTVASDTTKTKSSMRTLPMVPQFRELLLRKKEEQAELRRVCGKCYNKEFLDYVCVNALGERIKPSYLTNSFPAFVVKNGMRRIRFHDLRHPDVKQATKNNEYLIEFLKIMRIDTLLQVHYSPFLSSKASWRVVSISIRLS